MVTRVNLVISRSVWREEGSEAQEGREEKKQMQQLFWSLFPEILSPATCWFCLPLLLPVQGNLHAQYVLK